MEKNCEPGPSKDKTMSEGGCVRKSAAWTVPPHPDGLYATAFVTGMPKGGCSPLQDRNAHLTSATWRSSQRGHQAFAE